MDRWRRGIKAVLKYIARSPVVSDDTSVFARPTAGANTGGQTVKRVCGLGADGALFLEGKNAAQVFADHNLVGVNTSECSSFGKVLFPIFSVLGFSASARAAFFRFRRPCPDHLAREKVLDIVAGDNAVQSDSTFFHGFVLCVLGRHLLVNRTNDFSFAWHANNIGENQGQKKNTENEKSCSYVAWRFHFILTQTTVQLTACVGQNGQR
jgi:hypothetical protein